MGITPANGNYRPGIPFQQLGPTGKMEGVSWSQTDLSSSNLSSLHVTTQPDLFQNLVTVEGKESLIMRNDTKNVDEAGEMKRTLSFSPEGITETLYTVKQDATCKRFYTRNGR